MMLTPEQLAEIRARADAATAGPWEVQRYEDYFEPTQNGFMVDPIWEMIGSQDNGANIVSEPDAQFIAHARDDVPALLHQIATHERVLRAQMDENVRLREENYRLRHLLGKAEEIRIIDDITLLALSVDLAPENEAA